MRKNIIFLLIVILFLITSGIGFAKSMGIGVPPECEWWDISCWFKPLAVFVSGDNQICSWEYDGNQLTGTAFPEANSYSSNFLFATCTVQPLVYDPRVDGEIWKGAIYQMDMYDDKFEPGECYFSGTVSIGSKAWNYANEPCKATVVQEGRFRTVRVSTSIITRDEDCIESDFPVKQYCPPTFKNLKFTVKKFVECIPQWVCGDWSECVDGKQTRPCNDGCGNTKTEEQACEIIVEPIENITEENVTEPIDNVTETPTEPEQPVIIITPICNWWNPMTWGNCFKNTIDSIFYFFSFKWLFSN